MRALAILIILAVAGFFGYQYAVEGRSPNAAIGVLTGATAAAEAEAAAAEAAAAEAAAAEAEAEAAAAEAAAAEAAAAEAAAAEAAAAEAAAAEAAAAEAAAADVVVDDIPATVDLLTIDGFNADQVIALIAGSDLAEAEKTTLISAVTAAQNSPALLQPMLERLQQALGE
jgi:nucleoid-associated protein YgaU